MRALSSLVICARPSDSNDVVLDAQGSSDGGVSSLGIRAEQSRADGDLNITASTPEASKSAGLVCLFAVL